MIFLIASVKYEKRGNKTMNRDAYRIHSTLKSVFETYAKSEILSIHSQRVDPNARMAVPRGF